MHGLAQLVAMNILHTIRECEIEKRPMVFAGMEDMKKMSVFPFPHLHDGIVPGWIPLEDGEMVKVGLKVVQWSNGHFYCTAFILNPVTKKLVYLSISDVRHFPNEWANNILMRTVKHGKDYTGGANTYTTLDGLGARARALTA